MIAVVVDGKVIEKGSHDFLMKDPESYYRKLVEKQEAPQEKLELNSNDSMFSSESGSDTSFSSPSHVQTTTPYSDVTPLDAPDTVQLLSGPPQQSNIPSSSIEAVYDSKSTFTGVPHICFKNVSFSYPARPTKPIFFGFNMSIQQGETVALVGPR